MGYFSRARCILSARLDNMAAGPETDFFGPLGSHEEPAVGSGQLFNKVLHRSLFPFLPNSLFFSTVCCLNHFSAHLWASNALSCSVCPPPPPKGMQRERRWPLCCPCQKATSWFSRCSWLVTLDQFHPCGRLPRRNRVSQLASFGFPLYCG